MSIKNLFVPNYYDINAHRVDADIMNVANFTTTDLSADNVDVNNVLYINNSAFPLNNVNMSADNTGNLEIHATGGEIKLLNTTPAISTSTGSLVVSGGLAVAENEYIGGLLRVQDATPATSTSTGSLVLSGGAGIAGNQYIGGLLRVQDATPATSTSTGSVVVAGGVGVSGTTYTANMETNGLRDIAIGGEAYLQPSTGKVLGDYSTLLITPYNSATKYYEFSADYLKVHRSSASTSISTGCLVLSGGAGISGAMNVGGSITTNQGIYLPTIGATPSLMNYYIDIDGPYDYPTTGCIVASSLVVLRYHRIGGLCTLMWQWIPPIFTGMAPGPLTVAAGSVPARYRPGEQVEKIIRVKNGGTAYTGVIVVSTDGAINFYAYVSLDGFTATSEIEIFAGSITYRV
jgi:hypothetical protein